MAPVRLGLRENLAQFSLLVVVNAFVGAMVGMERSILPPIPAQEFHLVAHELPCRSPLRPLRAQARAGRRLARRRTGAVPPHVGWLRPAPFYPGVAFVALLGLFLSALVVRETKHHAAAESKVESGSSPRACGCRPSGLPSSSSPARSRALPRERRCSVSARRWCTPRCWPLSETSRIRRGEHLPSASTVTGVTSVTPSARCSQESRPTRSGCPWPFAGLTFASGVVVAVRMRETLRCPSMRLHYARARSVPPSSFA